MGKGDPVAVFMPMVVEAVVAAYAIAKLGAIYMPIFSGFAPSAVAARLQDAEAKASSPPTAACGAASQALMKPAADEAVAEAPVVRHVIVLERLGVDVSMKPGRDLPGTSCAWPVRRRSRAASSPRTRAPRTRS